MKSRSETKAAVRVSLFTGERIEIPEQAMMRLRAEGNVINLTSSQAS